MQIQKEWSLAEGGLSYIETKEGVEIVSVSGNPIEVVIPRCIEEQPVIAIGKKAFLSKKQLKRVCVPESVSQVGDWAFAYCDGLQEITFEGERTRLGKAVFLECGKLLKVSVGEKGRTTAALLAAVAAMPDAAYLLQPEEVGTSVWYQKWDAKMLSVLHGSDSDGYSKQVLCGEEDYGSTDLEAYLSNSRKRKVRLLLLRLLHDESLKEEVREELIQYLCAHTKGCKTEETWSVIWKEHGNDREYYELFAALSCITRDNLGEILQDIGEEFPEMKAFFLRLGEQSARTEDFFSDFEL